jgi:hypothetical protein
MLYAPEQFRDLKGRQHRQVSMDTSNEKGLLQTVSRFSIPKLRLIAFEKSAHRNVIALTDFSWRLAMTNFG